MKTPSIITRLFRPERKGLAAPDGDLLAMFGLGPLVGGAVGKSDSLQIPAVAAAVRVISEAAASLDAQIKDADGNIVENHPARAFLVGAANGWTSGFELIRDLMIDALTDDRGGMVFVNRPNGEILELLRYRDGTINVDTGQSPYGEPMFRINGQVVDAGDVIHLRAPFGKSPLTLARKAISVAWALQTYAEAFFTNAARPSGALKFPPNLGADAVKAMREAWAATQSGGANAGKTPILYDGADFVQLTMTSTDAQFIEHLNRSVDEIARAFRVPPSMLFNLDRATWGNTEQMGREFLTYCLEPWLRALEGALTRALFSGADAGQYRVVFDRDDMTRADLQTRAATINSLVAAQVINPNEGRAWLGMPDRAGGDVFLNPNISTGAGNAPAQ